MGKIITYASGLDAAFIIWIVTDVRAEHASAIQWLNAHTTDEVSFFLIEVHAYTIGDSFPAPMFKVIEQPNDFAKQVKSIAQNTQFNESQTKRLEFWNRFNEVLDEKGRPFNKRKATTDHWYSVAIGSSQCHISIDLVNREHKIRVGVWIPDNKELFDTLFAHKNEIEQSVGLQLTWNRLDNKKASSFYTYIKGLDFNNQSNYDDLMKRTIDLAVAIKKAVNLYL